MCSFDSYKTRFEFLSQFRKVRNVFECFVTQVQTRLLKTKRVWPMQINVICTVQLTITAFIRKLKQIQVTITAFIRKLKRYNSSHCVLINWHRILVRAVKGLIYRAGIVSICPLL